MKRYITNVFVYLISILAKRLVASKRPFVIGVTWSIWKTTCRNIISQTLSHLIQDKVIYTPSKNFNNEIWLCLGVFAIDDYKPTISGWLKVIWTGVCRLFTKPKYDILVLEYGIDSPWDMDQLLHICTPDVAIMTKIDLVHSANFAWDVSLIFAEKSKLIRSAKSLVFLDQHDRFTSSIIDDIKVDRFTYGDDGDIQSRWFDLYKDEDNQIISKSDIFISWKQVSLSSNLLSEFMVNYTGIWVCISQIYLHKNKVDIKVSDHIHIDYKLEPGRFNLFYWDRVVIVDWTYNASPQSMMSAIQNTVDIRDKFFEDYKIVFVLGEMRELGPNSISAHQNISTYISQIADAVIRVSGDAEYGYKHHPRLQDSFVQTNMEVRDVLRSIFDRYEDNQQFMILFKSSQWEIYLEEAIKPWINKLYHDRLPRQDIFWKKKKVSLDKWTD